jgi:hypothetical protein
MTFKCPDKYRVVIPQFGPGDATNGVFRVPLKHNQIVMVQASNGMGWEHVSVSRRDRTPTWDEMCQVKALFWDDEDCVVQYHPPKSEYINNHPHCLHLWRPMEGILPRPPKIMVGV